MRNQEKLEVRHVEALEGINETIKTLTVIIAALGLSLVIAIVAVF